MASNIDTRKRNDWICTTRFIKPQHDYQTTKYRINELTEIMDAYTLNYLTKDTSETLKKLYCLNHSKQQEREYISQQKKVTILFEASRFTETDKEFLTMLNFEHTKLTQTQFE